MVTELMDFFRKLWAFFFGRKERRVFFIGDTHFGHRNINRYSRRPFKGKHHMNSVLTRNWNRTVGKDDIVYFLGDLVLPPRRLSNRQKRHVAMRWLSRLNGRKIWIKGNHDKYMTRLREHMVVKYEDRTFYLVHRPYHRPENWTGWTICGHTHKPMLIDQRRRIVNVSVENVQYRPISLERVVQLIDSGKNVTRL